MTTSVRPGGPSIAPGRGNPATRTLLRDAAVRILDQKNFFDVGVDDRVQEAGVARGTFYIYFRDKYDLLAALSQRLNDELFDQAHVKLDRHTKPYDRIRLSLRRVIAAWEQHAMLFRATTQAALIRPDFLTRVTPVARLLAGMGTRSRSMRRWRPRPSQR